MGTRIRKLFSGEHVSNFASVLCICHQRGQLGKQNENLKHLNILLQERLWMDGDMSASVLLISYSCILRLKSIPRSVQWPNILTQNGSGCSRLEELPSAETLTSLGKLWVNGCVKLMTDEYTVVGARRRIKLVDFLLSHKTRQSLGSGCKVPVYTNHGDIRVSSPSQAYVPDDLQLKELFRAGSSMVNFTWHPNPSDAQIPLDILLSIYNHMGVRNISQAIRKTEVSMQQMSLRKLKLGMGLYRICVAYLAKPSFKFSADKRHQLVRALIDCPVYEVTWQLKVEYSLVVAPNVKVNKKAMVIWEKHPKPLLIHTLDRTNEKEKMLYATNFAEAISQGLLVEFPDLVEGLCEIIKLGCAFSFKSEAVDFMLQSKNIQLFIADERFLSSYFD